MSKFMPLDREGNIRFPNRMKNKRGNMKRLSNKRAIKAGVIAAITGAILCGISLPVWANLSANPIIMGFDHHGSNRQDITLKNSANRPQYLEITAYKIDNVGAIPEQLSTDPNPSNVGLLVAPRRIVLKPGEEKIIRVIRLNNNQAQDQAWRVHIKPAKVETEAKTSGAMMQLSYKSLVFARPENAVAKLVGGRVGNRLTLHNQGNSNAILRSGSQCDIRGEHCKRVIGKRLWSNTKFQTNLPYSTPVKFEIKDPNGIREIVF